jgi:SAM-dependent methyltransferase
MSGSAGAAERLKRTVKRSRLGVIGGRIGAERVRDVRRAMGRKENPMGATHRGFELDDSLDYIDAVFADYARYAGLAGEAIEGKTILELGPGDSFGVALRFIGAGAAKVITADRFIPIRDSGQQRAIYEGVLSRMSADERGRVDGVLTAGGIDLPGVGIDVRAGVGIEEAPAQIGEASVDVIVSRAVLEHVFDLDAAFAAMHRLLKPGGRMAHKVDLRDHGLFTDGGQHALEFLTVSDRVYTWMGEESAGLPNRRLQGYYERVLDDRDYETEFLTTHLAGVDAEVDPHVPAEDGLPAHAPLSSVEKIRPRLLPRFRNLSATELAVAGFWVIADKPPARLS